MGDGSELLWWLLNININKSEQGASPRVAPGDWAPVWLVVSYLPVLLFSFFGYYLLRTTVQ